ncbi:MAG: aquaporin [Verrucomicrobia bacterium]|nr:aquaporin [Verrucomicrobiota bacterium]
MKALYAEFLGTFTLVFAGTGAIVIDHASHGAIGHAGVALTFGLVVLAMIHTFGDVSGAHLNPAVTIGFAVARRFAWTAVPGYVIAQLAGAFTASGLLRFLFPADATLGATLPPARSLAPALVSGHLEHLWLYLVAPVIGALLAVPACICVREPQCCARAN